MTGTDASAGGTQDATAPVLDGPAPADTGAPANAALAIGLVGYWRFEETSGPTVRDSSGNGNQGVLLGSTLRVDTFGRFGGALDVPPADGNGATCPASASIDSISTSFTIAGFVFRVANRSSGLSNILSRRANNTTNSDYFAFAFDTAGRLRGFVNTQVQPAPPSVASPTPLPLNQWSHVAFSYDGTTLRLYVNGVASGVAFYAGRIDAGNMPLCLGCGHNRPLISETDETLAGRVDELLLYNRALPPAELQMLAAGELPPAVP